MFFIIPLFCIANAATLAAPLVDPISSNSTRVPDIVPSVVTDQRSTWDIVWSCLATIFACTWVSVHPNIPGPNDGRIQIALIRLELMFWAIVTPEMIIFWAIRQWVGARIIAKTFKKYGWTMTHGHFLQMGGFMLAEGDDDIRVLELDAFHKLLSRKEVGFPVISEKEIQDRSKGDGLSKALVVAQTSWFIAQCISRKAQGIEITEIELVTVAFAFLNGIMYFLWWSKPVDVSSCVRVYRLTGSIPRPYTIDIPYPFPDTPHTRTDFQGFTPTPTVTSSSFGIELEGAPPSIPDGDTTHSNTNRDAQGSTSTVPPSPPEIELAVSSIEAPMIVPTPPKSPPPLYKSGPPKWLPERVVLFIFRRLNEMRGVLYESDKDEYTRMTTFSPSGGDPRYAHGPHLSVSVISMFFGLIHCSGWFLVFPSGAERIIWRVSAVIISAVPVLVLFSHSLLHIVHRIVAVLFERSKSGLKTPSTKWWIYPVGYFWRAIWWIFILFIPVYLLARLLLLVEAFISLRNLPPGAYSVVIWTTYLPHI